MANYTAADIKALREKTGAGMLDVKKALDEANGDQQKAAEIIRVKGLKGITKREGRATAEGLVAARVENGVGYMIEVNSETDFVAKSDPFIAFGQNVLEAAIAANASTLEELQAASYEGKTVEAVYLHKTSKDLPAQVGVLLAVSGENTDEIAHDVAVHIAAMSPKYLDSESIPADQIETEKRVARETAIAEGKPEKILDKIVEGRLKGFFKENTLLDQDFAKDSRKSVAQVLSEAGATATAFARFRVGA